MKKHFTFSFVAIGLAFLSGFYYVTQFSREELPYLASNREVASINRDSKYQYKVFNDKIFQNTLISKTEVTTSTDLREKFISLKGFSPSLCNSFPTINLEFDAYGISTSGEPTQFKIKAKCTTALDFENGAVIRIPVEDIKKQNITVSKIIVNQTNETFEFTNMDSDWNKTWILTKITFESENDMKEISLNHFDNDRLNYKPIVVEF